MPGLKTNERVGTRAVLRHSRMSAFKAREVLDLIRGVEFERATEILDHSPRGAAEPIAKLLRSAAANAQHNDELDPEELFVSACYADEGTTLKRWRPRARGRATRIRKRTCHITVILSRLPEEEIVRRRARLAAEQAERRQRRVAGTRRARRQQTDEAAGMEEETDLLAADAVLEAEAQAEALEEATEAALEAADERDGDEGEEPEEGAGARAEDATSGAAAAEAEGGEEPAPVDESKEDPGEEPEPDAVGEDAVEEPSGSEESE